MDEYQEYDVEWESCKRVNWTSQFYLFKVQNYAKLSNTNVVNYKQKGMVTKFSIVMTFMGEAEIDDEIGK